MRVLVWVLRAFLFFALFAFALNNRHTVDVQWFFGASWSAPLVIVVLVAFGIGCAIGVLAMVPSWWRRRSLALRRIDDPSPPVSVVHTVAPSEFGPVQRSREGL